MHLPLFVLSAPADSLVDGDFERGLAGWNEAWSRSPGIKTTLDQDQPHGGKQCVRIEHTGKDDWSFQVPKALNVSPGDIYELRGWVRLTGEGDASICVTLKDADNKVLDWSYRRRHHQGHAAVARTGQPVHRAGRRRRPCCRG